MNNNDPILDIDTIQDVVNYGRIEYSFEDSGILIDMKYLDRVLDEEAMVRLTDKIKDLVVEELEDAKDTEDESEDD